jgi:hypothetical protein
MIIFKRGEHQVSYEPQEFWSLAKLGQLLRSDLIFDWGSGQFLPVGRFADVEPYLPPKSLGDIIEDLIVGALSVGAVLVVGAGAIILLESVFGSGQPASNRKSRARNNEPLEVWKKEFVRVRDGETCTYCGCYAPTGHVDHKTSRANGGSNLLRNLAWACCSCNCSKGRMNAPQFRKLASY